MLSLLLYFFIAFIMFFIGATTLYEGGKGAFKGRMRLVLRRRHHPKVHIHGHHARLRGINYLFIGLLFIAALSFIGYFFLLSLR